MLDWWEAVVLPSILVGPALGLLWSIFSLAQRRRAYLQAGVRPSEQTPWLLVSFVSMSSYISLLVAVGLLAVHGAIASGLAWFLVAMAAVSFCSALWFATFRQPPSSKQQTVLFAANVRPLRRTA